MAGMGSSTPDTARLLAIIDLQNAIAAAALNADEVMHIVAERAAVLTSATCAAVALVDGEDMLYRAVAGTGPRAEGARIARAGCPSGRCVAECRPLRADDASGSTVVCVPLLYGETAVGALEVVALTALTDEDSETLRMLAQIIAIALHRAYTYPRPRVDSLQDALTGLGNRRAFDERLEAELNRNRRFSHSFSLALVRLGGLETAIDRLGQAAGDDMMRRLAAILKAHTRMIDGCFRVLADGLAIVMPGTSLEGAEVVAERCRAHAIEARLCDSSVRLGFGVVAAADETAAEIMARATAALDRDLGRDLGRDPAS